MGIDGTHLLTPSMSANGEPPRKAVMIFSTCAFNASVCPRTGHRPTMIGTYRISATHHWLSFVPVDEPQSTMCRSRSLGFAPGPHSGMISGLAWTQSYSPAHRTHRNETRTVCRSLSRYVALPPGGRILGSHPHIASLGNALPSSRWLGPV